ncbi:MAG: hypothetical protein JW829_00895 [Pirellulales bacterium]|nr:hypothetical protein [Pirellulales bacterium]
MNCLITVRSEVGVLNSPLMQSDLPKDIVGWQKKKPVGVEIIGIWLPNIEKRKRRLLLHSSFKRREIYIGRADMSTLDNSIMHKEHHEADGEHLMWLEEIGHWRTEHRRAASMLAQVQAALLEQDAALEAHAETVRAHEMRMQRHEREIADYERGSIQVDHDKLAELHQELQTVHDQAREAHQRIKAHHGMVTAEIRRLSEKLNAPM